MTTIETKTRKTRIKRRYEVAGWVVAIGTATALRLLAGTEQFAGTPLRHWFVQLGVLLLIVGTFEVLAHQRSGRE